MPDEQDRAGDQKIGEEGDSDAMRAARDPNEGTQQRVERDGRDEVREKEEREREAKEAAREEEEREREGREAIREKEEREREEREATREKTELEREERPEEREVRIQIDRIHYTITKFEMTGAELRLLPAPPTGPDRDLFEVVPGGTDRKIGDAQVVRLHNGMRFFTAPAQINPGLTGGLTSLQ